MPLLSEIKLRSPKEGDLLRGRDPLALAQSMCSRPLAGLSVVTEQHDFGGDLTLIERIRPHVDYPILCKDFHQRPADLKAAATAGADVVLLIVAMLENAQLRQLHEAAHQFGLETLIETHSLADVERLLHLGITPDLLGINNRNILEREVDDGDVSRTERLTHHLPPTIPILSESSIRGPEDARRARAAGADAVLVGTSILQAENTVRAIDELIAVGWP